MNQFSRTVCRSPACQGKCAGVVGCNLLRSDAQLFCPRSTHQPYSILLVSSPVLYNRDMPLTSTADSQPKKGLHFLFKSGGFILVFVSSKDYFWGCFAFDPHSIITSLIFFRFLSIEIVTLLISISKTPTRNTYLLLLPLE